MPTEEDDFNTTLPTIPAILTFSPNNYSIAFSVWPLSDNIVEEIECLNFTLDPIDHFVNVPEVNKTVTICIEDDSSEFS